MGTLMSQAAIHKLRLESNPNDGRQVTRAKLIDYLQRTGLTQAEFARRIQYAHKTLRMFLSDKWYHVAGNSDYICRAINRYIGTHPIAPMTQPFGELYSTANVRSMRESFQQLLRRPAARLVYGAPGKQKSFALEYLVAELNRVEAAKREPLQAAFYLYAIAQATPSQVMKAAAIACGSSSAGDRMRIAHNLAHDFEGRRVVLVVDEAQHLSINAFETLRILLDRPPHFSLLFSGSHDLKQIFDKWSAVLEQWNSRLLEKVCLPGVSIEEAEGIAGREIGDFLRSLKPKAAQETLDGLVNESIVWDVFADHPPTPQMLARRPRRSEMESGAAYINVRTLTNSIEQVKAQLTEEAV
jgi:hypothetical protein